MPPVKSILFSVLSVLMPFGNRATPPWLSSQLTGLQSTSLGSYTVLNLVDLSLLCQQCFVLIAMLVSIVVAYKLLKFVLSKALQWLALRIVYEKIDNFASPISIMIIYILVRLALPFLYLPDTLNHKIFIYGHVFLWFLGIDTCYKIIDLIAFYIVREQTVKKKFHFNLMLLPIVMVSLKVCVSILGIIRILKTLHFDVKGLLTGVGIGGLGFALASQDTIKNFFGSLVILTDKPFNVGDYIVAERIDGRVEEIGFRSTRIRSPQGSIIYVPNGKLADAYITNYGEKQYKGFDTTFTIPYHTSAAAIETFIEGLRKIIERCPIARADKYAVYLYELRDSIFYIKFRVDFNVTLETTELIHRQNILLQVTKLARVLDIRFAAPTQTIQMTSQWDKKLYPMDAETELDDLQKRSQDFFDRTVSQIPSKE